MKRSASPWSVSAALMPDQSGGDLSLALALKRRHGRESAASRCTDCSASRLTIDRGDAPLPFCTLIWCMTRITLTRMLLAVPHVGEVVRSSKKNQRIMRYTRDSNKSLDYTACSISNLKSQISLPVYRAQISNLINQGILRLEECISYFTKLP